MRLFAAQGCIKRSGKTGIALVGLPKSPNQSLVSEFTDPYHLAISTGKSKGELLQESDNLTLLC